MSLWTRITNAFRSDRVNRELNEEFESHIAEAIAEGRDPAEARKSFGSPLRQREASRDVRVVAWLDGLRADVIFGWRQLRRNKVTSATAILSLALAMGACVSAFRLIDALLLRPLPVSHADRLFALSRLIIDPTGKPLIFDGWAYPDFVLMRAAAKPVSGDGGAELIAVSNTDRTDLTYATDEEIEKGYVQYVSGWMFDSFGLRPALGRLLTENDDRTPGAHPYAVLSYDYWRRRFGKDPNVIGRTLRFGDQLFEIVGVGPEPFTGTEPGTVTDIFLPAMMHPSVTRTDTQWHRTLAVIHPGTAMEPLRAKLDAVNRHYEAERIKGFTGMSKQNLDIFLNQKMLLEPAASGLSDMQGGYRRAMTWMGVLVGLVLLIACANVANLMTALGASRAREMALRVSIGAGRLRLVQLVLVESALMALGAALLGFAFAWWSAPWVVQLISTPDNPIRLILPVDWRVLGFGVALIAVVMLLFGLIPALRASAIKPVNALKGGAFASGNDPHARRRLMNGMIAAQVAFCFLVVFVAGLFVTTFQRLANRPMGFDADHLLLLETVAPHGQLPAAWSQMAESLRSMPAVEEVAESVWPLMSAQAWSGSIAINGGPPGNDWGYFLKVSPGWAGTMKMRLIAGRDFRSSDTFPGAAIVNETFVKQFLQGPGSLGKVDPVGMTFEKVNPAGSRQRCQVVGVVADAAYRSVREAILPVAFVPFRELDEKGAVQVEDGGTFLVRTAAGTNPLALATEMRRKIAATRTGFRVSNVRTQRELIDAQTIRERLLAMLGMFFATVALLLAGIGLYGVLNYSVLQRRREIGIRVAVGARGMAITRLVTGEISAMVAIGVGAGLGLGFASVRYIETLFYEVKASDPGILAIPAITILAAAALATLPAVMRALRIDPAEILRSE
jgi:putative ABC transport system permease protein